MHQTGVHAGASKALLRRKRGPPPRSMRVFIAAASNLGGLILTTLLPASAQPEPTFRAICAELRVATRALEGRDEELITIQVIGPLQEVMSEGGLAYMLMCEPPDPQVLCVTYETGGRNRGEVVMFSGIQPGRARPLPPRSTPSLAREVACAGAIPLSPPGARPVSGTKAWFVMARVDRKLTRFTLGRYPATSLEEARERAREIISHLKAGRDPRQPRSWIRRSTSATSCFVIKVMRSMVTIMNERLGNAPHVVEAVVNHVSGPAKRGVAGVYNRAIYLEDRRRALEAWADFDLLTCRASRENAVEPSPERVQALNGEGQPAPFDRR